MNVSNHGISIQRPLGCFANSEKKKVPLEPEALIIGELSEEMDMSNVSLPDPMDGPTTNKFPY